MLINRDWIGTSKEVPYRFLHLRKKMRGEAGPRQRLLVAGLHILDRDLAARTFVDAEDGDERRGARGRVLDLLPELVRLRIQLDPQPGIAQLAGKAQRFRFGRLVED